MLISLAGLFYHTEFGGTALVGVRDADEHAANDDSGNDAVAQIERGEIEH